MVVVAVQTTAVGAVAGGVMYDSARTVTARAYAITVGAGGTGATYSIGTDQITGRSGGNSSIFDAGGTEIKALGGGYGGSDVSPYNSSVEAGAAGGSGGGAARKNDGGTAGAAGAGSGTGTSFANAGGAEIPRMMVVVVEAAREERVQSQRED